MTEYNNERDHQIGANILDNLTTGMYSDSKVIYREYIQNACDQIDIAVKEGLLSEDTVKNQCLVDIYIDQSNKNIRIIDYATGIKSTQFKTILGDIANSDKKIGENKGFRGIGRLAGLAYCDKLIFTSKYKDESNISIMECDGALMRQLLQDNYHHKQYTIFDVLDRIFSFSTSEYNSISDHFFQVELVNVNFANRELLDVDEVREYLSFVAPVPYSSKFYMSADIYKYANDHGHKIDEYRIKVNGEELLKEYSCNYSSRGEVSDAIHGLEFQEFTNKNGEELGWMWLAVTGYKGALPKTCKMRGLRLRKENIQIGDGQILVPLFSESRGASYYIGEIFATSPNLIPNSQRDNFNGNETRKEFESAIQSYIKRELDSIYRVGSELQSGIKKINKNNNDIFTLQEKVNKVKYINDEDKIETEEKIKNLRQENINIIKKIKRFEPKEIDKPATLKEKVYNIQIEALNSANYLGGECQNDGDTISTHKGNDQDKKIGGNLADLPVPKTFRHRTDRLSNLSKNDRKLIGRIYKVIKNNCDDKLAEQIISAIEDEFK